MSFKFFRPTVLNIKNVNRAPAFKNTASASHAARVDKFQDHFDSNNVEGRSSTFDLDRGYSVFKESGESRGHSILESSFGDKLAGRDSILSGGYHQNESQFGEDGLRSAGEFGKGMAGNDGCPRILQTTYWAIAVAVATFNPKAATAMGGAEATTGKVNETAEKLCKIGQDYADAIAKEERDAAAEKVRNPETTTPDQEQTQQAENQKNIVDNKVQRPGVDDNGGGGTLDARGWEKLSQGLNKDPIINPNGEDLGGGYLSDSQLKQMESDLRNAKDPATNWGEEHYDNFNGTVVMDRVAVSLKAPATNWGNDYTSTVEVIETMITAPDVF
jgi:hypothetical protein